MTTEYIFVYGTLRQGASASMHKRLAQQCEYVCEGYLQGRLYEVAGYPGAIESDNATDRVYGELYAIRHHDILSQLDAYEECTVNYPEPYEYLRKKCPISLPSGGNVVAWVYVFNHPVVPLRQIQSGDYLGDQL